MLGWFYALRLPSRLMAMASGTHKGTGSTQALFLQHVPSLLQPWLKRASLPAGRISFHRQHGNCFWPAPASPPFIVPCTARSSSAGLSSQSIVFRGAEERACGYPWGSNRTGGLGTVILGRQQGWALLDPFAGRGTSEAVANGMEMEGELGPGSKGSTGGMF